MIAGSGMPMDAVVSDFVAGAAEILSPDAAPDHWDVIEGQGSLFHPALCRRLARPAARQPAGRASCSATNRAATHLLGYPDFPTPSLPDAIALHLAAGLADEPEDPLRGRQLQHGRAVRRRGGSRHGSAHRTRLGLPVADPMRGGPAFERLVEACLA